MPYKITIIIEKSAHGYHAHCPHLAGCQSQGGTLDEAVANIREAAGLYLETLSDEEKRACLSGEVYFAVIEVDAV